MTSEKSVVTYGTKRCTDMLRLGGICVCKRISDNRSIFKFRFDSADVKHKEISNKEKEKIIALIRRNSFMARQNE
jgi:hypothetical protein